MKKIDFSPTLILVIAAIVAMILGGMLYYRAHIATPEATYGPNPPCCKTMVNPSSTPSESTSVPINTSEPAVSNGGPEGFY